VKELSTIARNNAKIFYNLQDKDEVDQPSSPVVPETQGEPESPKGKSGTLLSLPQPQLQPQPIQRPVGGEVPGVTNGDAKYACVTCRQILARAQDVIPHHQGIESLKSIKRERDTTDSYDTNVLFVKEVEWARKSAYQDRVNADEYITSGVLSCPGCDNKIGKWVIATEMDATVDDPVIYILTRKRLDVMVGEIDAKTLVNRAQEYEIGDEYVGTQQKKNRKQHRKKQGKQSNKSNMGNFRNKNYTGKHEDGAEEE